MRKIILGLLLSLNLFGASSFFTLDNVKNLSFYYAGKNDFISKTQSKEIKAHVIEKLTKAGFIFGETDALILVVKINSMRVDATYVINVEVSLDEDVVTNREGNVEAFALTYLDAKMIKSTAPYKDAIQTLDLLVDKFIALHKDDNEE